MNICVGSNERLDRGEMDDFTDNNTAATACNTLYQATMMVIIRDIIITIIVTPYVIVPREGAE